jgi:CheY-like chemotaxis protein
MNILLIEDNAGFAGDLQAALSEIPQIGSITTVADKEGAVKELATDLVDLVILDLSINPSKDIEIPDPEHGQALFHQARELRPGTPIFVLTGSEVPKFSRGLAKFGNQVRLWGSTTEIETVSFFLKEEVDDLVKRVDELASLFSKMNGIAINTRGKDLGLSPVQIRMLKSYANSVACVACDVSVLSGGLSDAKVVKATAVDRNRKVQALCAGKLGQRDVITAELEAYEKHVRKLGIGACPALFCSIENGVGMNGSIFYTLTDDDTLSLFERLAANPGIGSVVVANVRKALFRWTEAATADMIPIGSIRARMIDDDAADRLSAKYDLAPLRTLEKIEVQASTSCIHGDLHCGNILVKSNNEAVVIDFGDAGPGYSCLDPIALELSLIFHPDAKKLGLRENLIDNLEAWPDVGAFAGDDGLKQMILACREWAHDIGGGDRAVLAAAYAYGLRQLKYDTVPVSITLRFLARLSELINAL